MNVAAMKQRSRRSSLGALGTRPSGRPIASARSGLGNQALQRFLRGRTIQAKLTVNQPGDRYEQEADRVADQVMKMTEPHSGQTGPEARADAPPIQRFCPECDEDVRRQPLEEEEEAIQRQELEEAPYEEAPEPIGLSESTIRAAEEDETVQAKPLGGASHSHAVSPAQLGNGGRPLPASTREFMETRMGADFGGVRIRQDSTSARLARSLKARAFVHGNQIFFGQGEFQPQSAGGRRLLAHELTHVVQQGSANSRAAQLPAAPMIQRQTLSAAFSNFNGTCSPAGQGSCECGEDLGNNCAHYLSDALIRAGFSELDGGDGRLYRRRNGRVVCRAGRPVRAKELRNWFAGKASSTDTEEPDSSDVWAVYQERASDGQGHVTLHDHDGTNYDCRGTGDYPSWRTQNHYTW